MYNDKRTFKEWKEAVKLDGWFASHDRYEKAVYIVHNAHISFRSGELNRKEFKKAIDWGYYMHESAARCTDLRHKNKK